MPLEEMMEWALGAIGLGGYLFYKGFKILRKKRLIENIPTSTIRSIAMGLVEVKGNVAAKEEDVFTSPLTNSDCVYYEYKIEREEGSGKHSHWVTVREEKEGDYFYLEDDTGTVLVKTEGADVDVTPSLDETSGFGHDPPQEIIDYMEANDINWEGLFGANEKMKFVEKVVKPEQHLYVLGTATDNPFVEEGTAQKGYKDVMIKKGNQDKHFYITDKSEKSITETYDWKAPLMIFGGGALIVGGLALTLYIMGVF